MHGQQNMKVIAVGLASCYGRGGRVPAPSLLYIQFGSFLGVKRPGRRVDHPVPFSAEIKEESFSCACTVSLAAGYKANFTRGAGC